ncbi:MAG: DNA polymerase III subunit epsilon, partial [Cohaesibacteraceae bacterium]|nr:DNA polymerase III subunit epsilon [Cohaesibacteraceae bacterium]
EIGGVELIDQLPTGNIYHQYINPERSMPKEAFDVHGLGDEFLLKQPLFKDIVQDFLKFIDGAKLVIHNARFDMGFLNAELTRQKLKPLPDTIAIDTLLLARKKFPAGPNSLDALCKRFGIDNSRRAKHGALLDSEILAEVYIELLGGRQTALFSADQNSNDSRETSIGLVGNNNARQRSTSLPSRLTDEDKDKHLKFIKTLGDNPMWLKK